MSVAHPHHKSPRPAAEQAPTRFDVDMPKRAADSTAPGMSSAFFTTHDGSTIPSRDPDARTLPGVESSKSSPSWAPVAMPRRYRAIRQVGRGGMADVYETVDSVLEGRVAFKSLRSSLRRDPYARAYMLREARLLAKLDHPHIVRVHDAGEDARLPFVVQEWVPGMTLDALIAPGCGLPLPTLMQIIKPLCDALDYMHAHHVVHCDVKPDNIMLRQDQVVKLIDFGIALDVRVDAPSSVVAGTPSFMPPEQFVGEGLRPQSDVYGLGVTLFKLLTGELPFKLDTVSYAHFLEAPPSLRAHRPELSEAFEKALHRALSPDPDARFYRCGDFWRALAEA